MKKVYFNVYNDYFIFVKKILYELAYFGIT